ncbi:AfsR/SARP family transcriptional regulator [Streptomyces thermocarboxydus]
MRRLEEARLLLHEWRYDAELALGDESLADLVPELSALAAEHPLREAYHRQLMLALHRTGRQAEALVVHRDLRARLADELGVEPGQPVREAHVEVLRGAGRGTARPGGYGPRNSRPHLPTSSGVPTYGRASPGCSPGRTRPVPSSSAGPPASARPPLRSRSRTTWRNVSAAVSSTSTCAPRSRVRSPDHRRGPRLTSPRPRRLLR